MHTTTVVIYSKNHVTVDGFSVREWRRHLLNSHRRKLAHCDGFDTTEDIITTYLRPFDYMLMPLEGAQ